MNELNDNKFQKWFFSLKPNKELDGEFREVHEYPSSKEQYVIVFRCMSLLGGDTLCEPISLEKKIESK